MVTRRQYSLARGVDEEKIAAAIRDAEAHTTGIIVVELSPHARGGVRKAAERSFARLRLHRAPHRNNILFFIVPSKREFAIIGDAGIHEKVGQEFWERLAAAVGRDIREADLTAGLVRGIVEIGQQLNAHFPRD